MPLRTILILGLMSLLLACESDLDKQLKHMGIDYHGVPEKPLSYIKTLPLEQQKNVLDLRKRVLQNLVFVQGGGFVMGDMIEEVAEGTPNAVKVNLPEVQGKWFIDLTGHDEAPYYPHWVELDSYSIAKYETTYGEADIFTEATGRDLFYEEEIGDKRGIRDANRPVWIGASWYDARAYCQWLGDITGEPFDLLTEAQWEYAARSRGRAVKFATDNGQIDYGRNIKHFDVQYTLPPGSFPPNPLGVYDMSGNVWEWVMDSYSNVYYEYSPIKNPPGPEGEQWLYKVSRGGGGYDDYENSLDVFRRARVEPDNWKSGESIRCGVNSTQPVNAPG